MKVRLTVLVVAIVILPVSALPAAAAVQADLQGWALTGGVNLRIPLSELNFPTSSTMPILTLGFSRVTLQIAGSGLQQATWTDSDWTTPQPMTGPRPTPDFSQTQGRMVGTLSLYAANLALAPEATTRFVFLGYAGSSYNFTMPSPVLCTIGPGCTPGVYYTTLNDPLTSAFSYSGPQLGVHGETRFGALSFSGNLAFSALSASGYVGWGSGPTRQDPTPVSGSGAAISGEVRVGYVIGETGRVSLGYQFVSFDVSGTAYFNPGGPTPWREWGSNQGATLAVVFTY